MKQITVGMSLLFGMSLLSYLLMPTASLANTRTGGANPESVLIFSFTPEVEGEVDLMLSWTNPNAHLVMVLVCGDPSRGLDPLPFGVSAGLLDRSAQLRTGLVAGVRCLVGVSSVSRSSGFRLHFNHASSVFGKREQREPLAFVTGQTTEVDPRSSVHTSLASEVTRQVAAVQQFRAVSSALE